MSELTENQAAFEAAKPGYGFAKLPDGRYIYEGTQDMFNDWLENNELRKAKVQITQLQAKIEALEKASQWQPIETAPKDGTTVIVGRPDMPTNNPHAVQAGCVGAAYYMDGHWVTPTDHELVGAFGNYVKYVGVTYWKPLPECPIIDAAIAKKINDQTS